MIKWLAYYLSKQNKSVLISACDLQRPAAIDQLETLGSQINTPVYAKRNETNPVNVAKEALEKAKKELKWKSKIDIKTLVKDMITSEMRKISNDQL